MKYAWTIASSIVAFIFILGLLNAFYSSFEVAVISCLVIIYVAVISQLGAMNIQNIKGTLLIVQAIYDTRISLDPNMSEDEREALKEELQAANEKVNLAQKKLLINSIANTIISATALFYLLGSF